MSFPRKKILISVAVLFVVLGVGWSSFLRLNAAPSAQGEARLFTVDQGASVYRIAKSLHRDGHIRSHRFFILLVRLRSQATRIKAGEYLLEPSYTMTRIIDILTAGAVVTQKFTIPEGLHINQIAEVLQESDVVGMDEFIAAANNPRMAAKYRVPFENVEGFLFPDTYIVAKGLSGEQIVSIMVERFFEKIHEIPFIDYSGEELRRAVIIASLVEREAMIDSERPVIAAVFYNRLLHEKRLESCATVQYILGKPKERLLFSDLKVESPYNTYLHKGLPPGPISNPGIDSIRAALSPADVDYLFFVSKGDGSHHFSKNYKEHLEAIERYNKHGTVGHQIS
jgi:UPF0755 protein